MGGFSIIMIKKEAVSHVECGDGSHIFVCQLKIGNVGVSVSYTHLTLPTILRV